MVVQESNLISNLIVCDSLMGLLQVVSWRVCQPTLRWQPSPSTRGQERWAFHMMVSVASHTLCVKSSCHGTGAKAFRHGLGDSGMSLRGRDGESGWSHGGVAVRVVWWCRASAARRL